jgi:hypothetical protein
MEEYGDLEELQRDVHAPVHRVHICTTHDVRLAQQTAHASIELGG